MSDLFAAPPAPLPAVYATADEMRQLLRQHFGGEGAVVMEEVGNGTGWSQSQRRWADMVVMETWPSRGLTVTGIEIKVSRSDWLHELKHPEKAEEIHRHCDFWWLAAPRGVVEKVEQVPEGWGYIELGADTKGARKLVVVRQPRRQDRPQAIGRLFVAAMLRAQQRNADAARERQISEEVDRRVAARLEDRREQDRRDAEMQREIITRLREEMGEGLSRWFSTDEVMRAVGVVHRAKLAHGWDGLMGLIGHVAEVEAGARKLREGLAGEMDRIGVPLPASLEEKLGRKPARKKAARTATAATGEP